MKSEDYKVFGDMPRSRVLLGSFARHADAMERRVYIMEYERDVYSDVWIECPWDRKAPMQSFERAR